MSEADKIIKSLRDSGKKVEEFYMSNKTSDKNVANIEDDVDELKSIMNLRTDSGFAYSQKNTLSLQKAIKNVLADYTRQKEMNEEHQKINGELRERIQELENKLQDINTYILINGIDEPLRTATQIQVKNQHEYIIQQKINKLEEERDHWHGCFIVAMESSIPKRVITDLIENETIDISGFECIAVEDLQELLGEEKNRNV